jgi:PncC family amidohydrolase
MGTIDDLLEVQIGRLLKQRGLKLAVAESCTGGLVADRITDVPGSSDYFRGGIVAYSYEAKVTLLGVSWTTLRAFGAVSRETVMEMARGGRTALGAGVAVSVSGIAGPGGGMPNKPIGTTWFGLSTEEEDVAFLREFQGDRRRIKMQAAESALQIVLDFLQGIPR